MTCSWATSLARPPGRSHRRVTSISTSTSTATATRRTRQRLMPLHLLLLALLLALAAPAAAMLDTHKSHLRERARTAFRHGWDHYTHHAFPEDEIAPLSCAAYHRDRSNPKDHGRNDALGDFSITAIDSLSTLALLGEGEAFWETVAEVVRIYWYNEPKDCGDRDGERCREGQSAWGRFQGRSAGVRGFDIDARVQVFETTIRGLGGLLSAHLFITGGLPGLDTPPPFEYKNELLLLAEDLGRRLLPALTESPTGVPYPRVNLRHGLPYAIPNPRYYNRARTTPAAAAWRLAPPEEREHYSEDTWTPPPARAAREKPEEEITATCTAGAGSLVLEFATLSHLTGDDSFHTAAVAAFNAVWSRRSAIGLVGDGISADTGLWAAAQTGVGAGVDSFFEYAFKAHILLANSPTGEDAHFLSVWESARAALERHVLVREPVAWWAQTHVTTGAPITGASWVDSLSAFFSGVLSAAGDGAEELAVGSNLVYTALWTRYAALPERYNTRSAGVESGIGWYPGRPEFVESTYLLYRATKDVFWLHVGEMALRDLEKRCWARCGWAGLQDVGSGERQDRMESFWLAETWMYLFLLFDEEHPLHREDGAWVFTTEGHPLVFPRVRHPRPAAPTRSERALANAPRHDVSNRTCAVPPRTDTLFSPTASRNDLYHYTHFIPHSLTARNSTLFPPSLPPHLIPPRATSAPLKEADTMDLLFPAGYNPNAIAPLHAAGAKVIRVEEGLQVLSLDALRLTLTAEAGSGVGGVGGVGGLGAGGEGGMLRIAKLAGQTLGRDETVFFPRALIMGIADRNWDVYTDDAAVELVVVTSDPVDGETGKTGTKGKKTASKGKTAKKGKKEKTVILPATLSRGAGALPPPLGPPSWRVHNTHTTACTPLRLPRGAEVVVVRRGGCTFSDKLGNVAAAGGEVILVVVEDWDWEVEGGEGDVAPVVDEDFGVALVMVRGGVVEWGKQGRDGGGGGEVRVGVRERVGVRVGGRGVGGLEVV